MALTSGQGRRFALAIGPPSIVGFARRTRHGRPGTERRGTRAPWDSIVRRSVEGTRFESGLQGCLALGRGSSLSVVRP